MRKGGAEEYVAYWVASHGGDEDGIEYLNLG